MEKLSSDTFFAILSDLGLAYSDKTGGQSFSIEEDTKIKKIQDNHFNFIHGSGEQIVVVDPIVFHRSVLTAEQTLDVTFFS